MSGKLNSEIAAESQPIVSHEASAAVASASTLRLMSLGHLEALADLVWLQALAFFGDNHTEVSSADALTPYVDVITDLDPRFAQVYLWAGTVTMYGLGIRNETVLESSRILVQGHERFPDNWEIARMLAVNYYLEYRPENPDEAAHYRALGAHYFEVASQLPGAPWHLHLAAASISSREQNNDRRIASARLGFIGAIERSDYLSLRLQVELALPPLEYVTVVAERSAAESVNALALGIPGELVQTAHPSPPLFIPTQSQAYP